VSKRGPWGRVRGTIPGMVESGRLGRWRELGPLLLCLLLGAALVALVRKPLIARFEQPSTKEPVSLLLTPEYSVLFSLGHRDALADYLFGTLLVRYGMSFRNKQPDPATYRYLDTITTLAPTFARPYMYADALLTMLPTQAPADAYLAVRRLHERGMARLPFHQELWLVAGQFATYLAPQRLKQPQAGEMQRKGMADLARTCELASNNANIPHGCIGVVAKLSKDGQRDAIQRMLTRMLAVNDDPELRQRILGRLQQDASVERVQQLEAIWQSQMPQVSRVMMSLLGPGPNVWQCAGRDASAARGCESTWRDWAQARSASGG
jgi:hypothetical protein